LGAMFQFRGIVRADVQLPNRSLQGLQSTPNPQPLNYVEIANPMANVRLEPTSSGSTTFLYAPGLPEFAPGVPDMTGTFWNMMLSDSCTTFNPCPAP
jgi:hypothetical protein